mmetsp:Transcript_13121/g.27934  ORF Transcript_13121/g.27934 Transcript_13121/m.27934 type:complete len:371 (+) Transcript_13121:57-1169(+)|eukprot:CAMPEP_0171350976 /NCGR_PEP_ID=MMETSP0878-20121228/37786_1 /TAXON_ID=67004 /ORGANISM="Thalassiosira weissflogii, Strain CCMP1336" /LENGTH=370 /DNA_ID=CAMNT_0011856071 /DNA_START=8 /DNA_END=1120 /DNA_ORIENTATION=-
MTTIPLLALILLSFSQAPESSAFLAPEPLKNPPSVCDRLTFELKATGKSVVQEDDVPSTVTTSPYNCVYAQQKRRDFLLRSMAAISFSAVLPSNPTITIADDSGVPGADYLYTRGSTDVDGDLTSRMFNPDGSLRDPNVVVEAKSRKVHLPFSTMSSDDGVAISISTDGVSSTSSVDSFNLKATYNLPAKWNYDSPDIPLYFDASEGKNGKACNRISVYSVTAPNLSMKTLEKASNVGVAKSLQMDILPGKYFDQGVLKADLISGRTTRKPIRSINKVNGDYDEQVYYEFDLAFAPLECPSFTQGNKENLGLGFCPYDNIFLVAATVLKGGEKDENGTLMVCVVECNKDEWKIANSDLKRVRSSFIVERV